MLVWGIQEGPQLHIGSSLITGLVATTVAAPFDVIKSRAMSVVSNDISLSMVIRGVLQEGPATLFRGWLPSYCRLAPHALICFPIFEQIRILLGLDYI